MVVTILIIFLIAFIVFSVWDAVNLRYLIKRPMRSDALNDKNYWELKYKMQYMITVFAVIVAVLTFLGYNSITNIRDDIKKEMASQLDSTRRELDSMDQMQKSIGFRLATNDSVLSVAQNAILGLSDREQYLKSSMNLRSTDLEKLKGRITEINEKNIIQQNVYIVENVEYTYDEYWDFKKYYFNKLVTNTGQPLPSFKKPPFIFAVSNQGLTFSIKSVTSESFELIISNGTPSEYGTAKKVQVTLFITESP